MVPTVQALEQYFAYLRAKGETSIDGPLLWAFTFNSLSAADLDGFKAEAEKARFNVESRPAPDGSYIGHVTHFSQHTAATLAERWTQFEGIVAHYPPCVLGGLQFWPEEISAP